LGTARIGVSYSVIEEAMNKTYLYIVLAALAAALLSAAAAVFLSGKITSPISVMAEAARSVGGGNLDIKAVVASRNELGLLADTFNMMTDGLKKAQKTQLEKKALEKEIEIAGRIQDMLIPKVFPGMEGYNVSAFYKPAKIVGGDYYDIIPISDGRFGIVVADVSGKGVPAALVMTMISGIINIEARRENRPENVMIRLNDEMVTRITGGIFATVFYAVLDINADKLDMVSAGHHEIFIVRKKKGRVDTVCPKGAAAGLLDTGILRDRLECLSAEMNKEDKLVIFTDGITDAKAPSGERFGAERVEAFLNRHAQYAGETISKKLIFEIENFTYGQEQADDIALLIIEKT